jgi:hypothetical protein
MLDIRPLVEFLDLICLENSVYFTVSDAYGRKSYECQWERKNDGRPWKVRISGRQNWHYFNAAEFIQFAQHDRLDMEQMIKEIATSLLSQAVFARTFNRRVEELLGKDRVDEAERQTQSFIDQLRTMAASSAGDGQRVGERNLQDKPSKLNQNNRPLRIVPRTPIV